MLVLFHYDATHGKSREDYYQLLEGRHQRFYSSIRLERKGITYMIYHKQEKSPRACFAMPSEEPPWDLSALRRSVYLGAASLERHNETVSCEHWSVLYQGQRVEFCLDEEGKPLIVEARSFRLDVLDFAPRPQPAHIFDPQRASKAPCGVIGAPPKDANGQSKPAPKRPFF